MERLEIQGQRYRGVLRASLLEETHEFPVGNEYLNHQGVQYWWVGEGTVIDLQRQMERHFRFETTPSYQMRTLSESFLPPGTHLDFILERYFHQKSDFLTRGNATP